MGLSALRGLFRRCKETYDFPYPQYDFPYPQYDFPYPQYDFPYVSRPSHPIFAPQHQGGRKEPQEKPNVKISALKAFELDLR